MVLTVMSTTSKPKHADEDDDDEFDGSDFKNNDFRTTTLMIMRATEISWVSWR